MGVEPLAMLNGQLLPLAEAGLALNDAGFVYGATVTERFRTFAGRPFHLDRHLQRFRDSARLTRIPLLPADDELETQVARTLEVNRLLGGELACVLFATPGPVGAFFGTGEDGPPTLGIYAFRLDEARFARWYREGVALQPSPAVMPAALIPPQAKHRSRLHWWLAERQQPGEQLLYVTPAEQWVRESAIANFLWVRGGAVHSPPAGTILPGIARGVVVELCGELQIPFRECEATLAEVHDTAEECLLTNSTVAIVPVASLEGRRLPVWGPVASRLEAAFASRVGTPLRASISPAGG